MDISYKSYTKSILQPKRLKQVFTVSSYPQYCRLKICVYTNNFLCIYFVSVKVLLQGFQNLLFLSPFYRYLRYLKHLLQKINFPLTQYYFPQKQSVTMMQVNCTLTFSVELTCNAVTNMTSFKSKILFQFRQGFF